MYKIGNLRCLWNEGNGQVITLEEIPLNVEFRPDPDVWRFDGGEYRIGSAVRVSHDGELLNGPILIFDCTNQTHQEKAERVRQEATIYRRLIYN